MQQNCCIRFWIQITQVSISCNNKMERSAFKIYHSVKQKIKNK